jgi:acetyl esterase/lipase
MAIIELLGDYFQKLVCPLGQSVDVLPPEPRRVCRSGPTPSRATFIAGDSASGSLTLATLLALRDRRRPLPTGSIALSATTDLTLASESVRSVNDPIISARTMPVFRDHYLGKTDSRNTLASPVFGDYRGIPPLLIQVGEHEMLRDDSIRLAEKLDRTESR